MSVENKMEKTQKTELGREERQKTEIAPGSRIGEGHISQEGTNITGLSFNENNSDKK